MRRMTFADAIDEAVADAMGRDPRIIVFGEDVQLIRRSLYARFGGTRVRNTPISESAFLGAAVGAAMAGLRPVVEIMLVDFVAVALDALVNHAAKLEGFSGGAWRAPLVVRAACGGGYGDGGQHEQSLWGWLAHIPGLAVVVPSCPADASGLMLTALEHDGPVVFLEHKLLADNWLEALGRGGRKTVAFDVPADGARAAVPTPPVRLPFGRAAVLRQGGDLTLVSLAVGVHRALEAAVALERESVSAGVVDLRTVAPLDCGCLRAQAKRTGRIVVIDEDYLGFGLSGEIAACLLEAGLAPRFARVTTEGTIPYARPLEQAALPNTNRIMDAARRLLQS